MNFMYMDWFDSGSTPSRSGEQLLQKPRQGRCHDECGEAACLKDGTRGKVHAKRPVMRIKASADCDLACDMARMAGAWFGKQIFNTRA